MQINLGRHSVALFSLSSTKQLDTNSFELANTRGSRARLFSRKFMNSLSSRHFARYVAVAALSFMTGAVLFAHAQSADDRQAAERAVSALHRDGRGPGGRRDDGTLTSPDGNFAVIDLGENNGIRSQAVYDFAAKKVFLVRFYPNEVIVSSKALN
jgi:hypothetical protein